LAAGPVKALRGARCMLQIAGFGLYSRHLPQPASEMARLLTETPSILIDNVTDWLMGEALGEPGIERLVEGTVARVDAAGIPIQRFHISFNMLHPLYSGLSLTWRRGQKVEVTHLVQTGNSDNPAWRNSPLFHMIEHRIMSLRRRLVGPEAMFDFPILEELRAEGATDYFAFLIPFGEAEDDGLVGSWTTDRKRGFFDADLRALHRIQRRLAVACRMIIRGQVAKNVVATYLGRGAGERVLAGQIKRGDGETIPAVIWYSDLRGSTAMAERLDREAYTAVLNEYFECIGGAVLEAGGEILDFIGDAVLAIFPIDPEKANPGDACAIALGAAKKAQSRIDRANEEHASNGMPTLSFGLALHIGDMMFGNIGTRERLSFSVIGPSVNQVARLEALTKVVGRQIVASKPFAQTCLGAWESLGKHQVQGIANPVEVFAPRRAAPAKPARQKAAPARRVAQRRSRRPVAKAR
jgi:adenylate cyclase